MDLPAGCRQHFAGKRRTAILPRHRMPVINSSIIILSSSWSSSFSLLGMTVPPCPSETKVRTLEYPVTIKYLSEFFFPVLGWMQVNPASQNGVERKPSIVQWILVLASWWVGFNLAAEMFHEWNRPRVIKQMEARLARAVLAGEIASPAANTNAEIRPTICGMSLPSLVKVTTAKGEIIFYRMKRRGMWSDWTFEFIRGEDASGNAITNFMGKAADPMFK